MMLQSFQAPMKQVRGDSLFELARDGTPPTAPVMAASANFSYQPSPSPLWEPQPASVNAAPVFSGVPVFSKGEAVLFDSVTDADRAVQLPQRLSQLTLAFPTGDPATPLDTGLLLLLYLDDLAAPRMTVRLAEMVRQGGTRPLNLGWQPGQILRLVLADQNGVWQEQTPTLVVSLA